MKQEMLKKIDDIKAGKITSLDCSFQDIGRTEFRDYVAPYLSRNHSITHLNLANNSLHLCARELSGILKNNRLIELDLSWTGMPNRLFERDDFADKLAACTSLRVLKMIHCIEEPSEYHTEGPVLGYFLLDSMSENRSLQTLLLDANCMGDQGAKIVAEFFKKNTDLITLSFVRNQFNDLTLAAAALTHNNSLQSLDLSYNPLSTETTAAFLEMLATNQTLHALYLQGTGITAASFANLTPELTAQWSITTLDFSHNPEIQEEGAQQLAAALQENRSITELKLNRCNITDAGAEALIALLAKKPWLHSLELNDNPLSPQMIYKLQNALIANQFRYLNNQITSLLQDDKEKNIDCIQILLEEVRKIGDDYYQDALRRIISYVHSSMSRQEKNPELRMEFLKKLTDFTDKNINSHYEVETKQVMARFLVECHYSPAKVARFIYESNAASCDDILADCAKREKEEIPVAAKGFFSSSIPKPNIQAQLFLLLKEHGYSVFLRPKIENLEALKKFRLLWETNAKQYDELCKGCGITTQMIPHERGKELKGRTPSPGAGSTN